MTPQQRRVMVFLEAEADARRPVPTVADIARKMKINSNSGVVRLLRGLEERGLIVRRYACARAITIIRPVSQFRVFAWDGDTKTLRPSQGVH